MAFSEARTPKYRTDILQPKPRSPERNGEPSRSSSGRWATLNKFIDAEKAGMSAAECFVWVVLFRHASRDGFCSVSYGRIAKEGRVSARQAYRLVKALRDHGLVKVVRRGSPGHKSNTYHLTGY